MDIWAGVTLYIDLDYINVLISKTGGMVIEINDKGDLCFTCTLH